jgi:tRNA pseudouridine55 synthase
MEYKLNNNINPPLGPQSGRPQGHPLGPQSGRPQGHPLGPQSGILIINKPKGWTSFDVVAKIRNKLGVKKVGHTGTLDPMATGVLVLCLGKATKLAQKITGYDKEYIAQITLGATSNTDDAEGVITKSKPRNSKIGMNNHAISSKNDSNNEFQASSLTPPSQQILEGLLKEFTGKIQQVPPQFSAKKVDGKRAYAMARKGQSVDLKPVEVTIHELELLEYKWPILGLRVHCSKGVYVRALARDIGERLGVGGYLSSLVRTRVGDYSLDQAKSIEEASTTDILSINT